jgi:small subunit ribosomal protein S21
VLEQEVVSAPNTDRTAALFDPQSVNPRSYFANQLKTVIHLSLFGSCSSGRWSRMRPLKLPQAVGSRKNMQIIVRDNNIDQALRALKKKLQREGVYREMKLRRHYEKPSEKRAREHAAAVSRARKAERKRAERDR